MDLPRIRTAEAPDPVVETLYLRATVGVAVDAEVFGERDREPDLLAKSLPTNLSRRLAMKRVRDGSQRGPKPLADSVHDSPAPKAEANLISIINPWQHRTSAHKFERAPGRPLRGTFQTLTLILRKVRNGRNGPVRTVTSAVSRDRACRVQLVDSASSSPQTRPRSSSSVRRPMRWESAWLHTLLSGR
jgi:hypothetical protein